MDSAVPVVAGEQGGRGFSVMNTTGLLVFLNLAGMFPGYISFGFVADKLGRRKAFALYLFAAALCANLCAGEKFHCTNVARRLAGALWHRIFLGSGLIGSEIYPTSLRARALGFTYNGARALSSLSPFVIGYVGQARGLGGAFFLCAIGFGVSGVLSIMLPETRGKVLE